jgi:hypothetical protein
MPYPDEAAFSYASLTDEQLIEFVRSEGHILTPAMFGMLKEEFLKRNLSPETLDNITTPGTTDNSDSLAKIERSYSDRFPHSIWRHIIDEKSAGKTDEEILGGLMHNGITMHEGMLVIYHLPHQLEKFRKKSESVMLISFFMILAGLSFALITKSKQSLQGIYILSWCTVILGCIRLASGYFDNTKFRFVKKIITVHQTHQNIFI